MRQSKAQKAHEQAILDTVKKHCVPAEQEPYRYVIGTTLGLLWVTPFEDWIACRFEDVAKAREVYACNSFSGKYNFHSDDCEDRFEDLIEDLRSQGRLVDNNELNAQLEAFRKEREARFANAD